MSSAVVCQFHYFNSCGFTKAVMDNLWLWSLSILTGPQMNNLYVFVILQPSIRLMFKFRKYNCGIYTNIMKNALSTYEVSVRSRFSRRNTSKYDMRKRNIFNRLQIDSATGACEYGNKISSSMKHEEFCDHISDY
jgi:hypothetical protein